VSTNNLSLKEVTDRVNLIHKILETVMKDGTHYGTVPGCGKKKVLLKPGADLLAMTFKLVPTYTVEMTDMGGGHRDYDVTCTMQTPQGVIVGQGVGSASTMEKKYRYVWDDAGKARVERDDIADVYNTVKKMAKKRAHIDATLTCTGAADIFTQDIIGKDVDDDDGGKGGDVAMPKPVADAKSDAAWTPPEGTEVIRGITIDKVNEKKGAGKRGEWIKTAVLCGETWYSTFDAKLGATAQALNGQTVDLCWKPDGDYKTLVALHPHVTEKKSSPATDKPKTEPGDDSLFGQQSGAKAAADMSRAELLADIDKLTEGIGSQKFVVAAKGAGIKIDEGAAIEDATDTQLKDLVVILRSAKKADAKK